VRENNWDAAASLLRSASNSIGEALTKKPRVYTDFEDLKAGIDRTIKTVEAHEKDADNQIAYLETAIRALKVND
jgi:chaperonin cofactor prefoldin